MEESSEDTISYYLLVYIITVFVTVFLFGMVIATSYQKSQPTTDFSDKVYVESECNSDGSPIEEVRLSLSQKNSSDRRFSQSLQYTFVLNESSNNYTVDAGFNDELDVINDGNNSSVSVAVNGSTSRLYYRHLSNSSLHHIDPSVDLVREQEVRMDSEFVGDVRSPLLIPLLGNYTEPEVYDYEDYYSCITTIDSNDDDTVAFVSEDRIVLSEMTGDPTVYKVYSESLSRTTYIMGDLREKQIAHTNEIIRRGGSYNGTFDESQNIRVYSVDGMGPAGLIVNRFGERPTVYLEDQHISRRSIVVGHEWAHSYQNFRTFSRSRWWTEGSAEYIGALIENDAGSSEERSRRAAFSYGWNQNVDSKVRMSDPGSWENYAQYKRGPRIAYLVDVAIRHHNENKTILDLIDRMNKNGAITHRDTVDMIRDMTTEDFSERYDRLVTQSGPIDIQEELDGMETQRDVERLPETFEETDYEIVQCTYDGDVAVVEECGPEE